MGKKKFQKINNVINTFPPYLKKESEMDWKGCIIKNYLIVKLLNKSGSSSTIWLAYAIDNVKKSKSNNDFYAIKIHFTDEYNEGDKEIQLSKLLKDKITVRNINSPIDTFILTRIIKGIEKKNVCIVMNLMAFSIHSLLKIDKYENGMPLKFIKKVMKSTLETLSDLHNNNIIHGDIKPENILLNGIHKDTEKIMKIILSKTSKNAVLKYVSKLTNDNDSGNDSDNDNDNDNDSDNDNDNDSDNDGNSDSYGDESENNESEDNESVNSQMNIDTESSDDDDDDDDEDDDDGDEDGDDDEDGGDDEDGDGDKKEDILPRNQRDQLDALEKVTRRLEHTLGRLPTELEIAKEAGVSIEDYFVVIDTFVNVMPIDDVPENLLPTDFSADPLEKVSGQQFLGQVVDILKTLPEKQRLVMALHYQEDLSYREIAAVLDLTPGRISQLHTQAMISIRALLNVELST